MGDVRKALRTERGRLRLGWRLGAFLVATLLIDLVVRAITPSGRLWDSLALLVGATVSGWWLLASERRGPASLGFHLSGEAPVETLKGVGLGTVLGLAAVGLMAMVGGVRWASDDGTVIAWLVGSAGALFYFTVPAAAEEAFFRGYPLQALTESWGPVWSVAVTASAFGLVHLGNPGATVLGAANVAAAGLLLGVVYLKTASLWWVSGIHLGWNWSHGYVADVRVSGINMLDAPGYDGFAMGPQWLSGGSFGPEGSVLRRLCSSEPRGCSGSPPGFGRGMPRGRPIR